MIVFFRAVLSTIFIQSMLVAGEPDLAFPVCTERKFANVYKITCQGQEVRLMYRTSPHCTGTNRFKGNDTLKVPEGDSCFWFVVRPDPDTTKCQGYFAEFPVAGGDYVICDMSVFSSGKLHMLIRVAKGKQAVIGIKGGSYMYTGTGAWEEVIVNLSADYQLFTHHVFFVYANYHDKYYTTSYKYPSGAKVTNPAPEIFLDDVYFFKGDYFKTNLTSTARHISLEPNGDRSGNAAISARISGESLVTCFDLQGSAIYSGRADGFAGPSSSMFILGNGARHFLMQTDRAGRLPYGIGQAD